MMIFQRPCVVFGYFADNDVRLPGRLVERYREIAVEGVQWIDIATDPSASLVFVKQARYEVAALTIAGLFTVAGSVVKVVSLAPDDSTKHERLAILQMLDPTVDMEAFSRLIPVDRANVEVPWSYTNAEPLAKLLVRAQTEVVPWREVEACPDPFGEASEASQEAVLEATIVNDELEEGGATKKRRPCGDLPLNPICLGECVSKYAEVLKRAVLSIRDTLPCYEFGKDHVSQTMFSFKLVEALGMGMLSYRGRTLVLALLRPESVDDVQREAQRYANLLGIDFEKVHQRLQSRPENSQYDVSLANRWFEFMQPTLSTHLEKDATRSAEGPPAI